MFFVLAGGAVAVGESYWAHLPDNNGWVWTGAGTLEDPGIGWVYDVYWPWIYVADGDDFRDGGTWAWIAAEFGDAEGIYAFVIFDEGTGWLYTPGIGWGYDLAAGEWFSFDD
ncbi:MAG: hypothetical protein JJU00_17525 [Opitutales bacterium]|nr:hypothetical protein [Opitutales bacterium]